MCKYMNKDRSLINNSTAERFPNTMFMTIKKKAPILSKTIQVCELYALK